MNRAHLMAVLAAGALVSACASLPSSGAPKTRISPDYAVSGDADGARAFVYGARTVLELPRRPIVLMIRDEAGLPVQYEREGKYYRFSRKLRSFSVRANTKAMIFASVPAEPKLVAQNAVGLTETVPGAAGTSAGEAQVSAAPLDDVLETLASAAGQLHEIRVALKTATQGDAEAAALLVRISRIESQLAAISGTLGHADQTRHTPLVSVDTLASADEKDR